MPRIRTIKPEFFRSPSTAKVDPLVRIFYQALWCWADDFGIGETNIYGLLGFAFPDSDEISAQDLRRFCAECARHYGVIFYIVRERHYYAIPSWDEHQKTERRTDRRKHPTPDDPDAVPDLQFHDGTESAQNGAGKPAQNPRENGAGTGEQGKGNRGNFPVRATEVCHQSAGDVAPPPKCSRHINDPDPPDCGGCAAARRAFNAWKQRQDRDELEAKRIERQEKLDRIAAIADCPVCDENGFIELDDGLARCPEHRWVSHA
jgi:hypothetical protein